jgi:hypothetical protein
MKLARQLKEDRAMRNAAFTLFRSDLEQIRQNLKHRGLGTRLADRMGEGAADMMEDAVDYASENRGKISAIVLSAALWLARRPILRFLRKRADENLETEARLTSSEEGMTTSSGGSSCEQRET